MSERPIHLHLGLQGGQSTATGQTPAGTETPLGADTRDADTLAQDARHLRALLAQPPAAGAAQPPATTSVRPIDLFAQAPLPSALLPSAPAATSPPADLDAALGQWAQRLLVADASTGQRAVQIELAGEKLTGTSLQVQEEAGTLVAQFTCTREAAREHLSAHAPWLAQQLAHRLARTTCVRVQTDDPQDLCLCEAWGRP